MSLELCPTKLTDFAAFDHPGVRFVDEEPETRPPTTVDFAGFAPGEAILHLGGQYHSALPLTAGERVNLIVWLFGEHGVVRVAPQDEWSRLQPHQRWARARHRPVERAVAPAAAAEDDDGFEDAALHDEL